jgi:hypothetical protein
MRPANVRGVYVGTAVESILRRRGKVLSGRFVMVENQHDTPHLLTEFEKHVAPVREVDN